MAGTLTILNIGQATRNKNEHTKTNTDNKNQSNRYSMKASEKKPLYNYKQAM